MDWNWFFGAISQCSAAIVGLFGAFVISKIISKDSEYADLNRDIVETQKEIEKRQFDLASFDFVSFNNGKNSEVLESKELQKKIDELETPPNDITVNQIEYLIANMPFSYFEERQLITKKLKDKLEDCTYKIYSSYNVPLFSKKIEDIQFQTKHTIKSVGNLVYRLKNFSKDKKMMSWIISLIYCLFIIGVMYPLSFMPAKSRLVICSIVEFAKNISPIKATILGAMFVLCTTIFTIFFFRNKRHYFKKEVIEQLESQLELDYYSIYLARFESNTRYFKTLSRNMIGIPPVC